MTRTNWSDRDLQKLSQYRNHRIIFDGFNYIWQHRLKGNKWETHSIDCYPEPLRPLHEIHYWTSKYRKELSERQSKQDSIYYREMKLYLYRINKVKRLRDNRKIKTRDKVKVIMNLIPEMSTAGIAELLNISRQMVHRHQAEISRGNTSN